MEKIIGQIAELKILPVVKLDDAVDAAPLAAALIAGGIPAAEVTFRTECAAQAIRSMTEQFPEMLVGAGTVLNEEQASAAIAAGAKFIVSPGFDAAVVRFCQEKGVPVFPGCITASEVQQAIAMGLSVLKFFPAEQSGGLRAIQALSAPFAQIRWMPTGGISLQNLKDYLAFPKIIACGGSYMVKGEDIEAKNWDKITELCRRTIRLIHGENPVPKGEKAALFAKEQKKYDMVAMGEVLMRLAAQPDSRISDGGAFTPFIGGSELNVASGAARLGLKAAMLTCLPDNDIGKLARREIHRMNVGDDLIFRDSNPSARLGVYYSEGGVAPRKPKVVYDRGNSSVFRLNLNHLPEDVYRETRLFHISGITLALPQIRETAAEAISRFREGGALISLDVNYRANLWNEETAYRVLSGVLPFVDVLFVSEESSRRMFRKTGTLEEIMKSYCTEYGVQIVATTARKVVSSREHGWSSTIYSAAKDRFFKGEPYESISVVDRIGSGDAFDAGALYGLLAKGDESAMALYGDAMAALKCTVAGDLPDFGVDEVESLIAARKSGDKSEMSR